MPGEHSVSIVARVGRLLILRLSQIPIAFFRLVKMMTRGTCKSIFGVNERMAAVSDRTTKFKHPRIVGTRENIKRSWTLPADPHGGGEYRCFFPPVDRIDDKLFVEVYELMRAHRKTESS